MQHYIRIRSDVLLKSFYSLMLLLLQRPALPVHQLASRC